jgi:hypothetical protein
MPARPATHPFDVLPPHNDEITDSSALVIPHQDEGVHVWAYFSPCSGALDLVGPPPTRRVESPQHVLAQRAWVFVFAECAPLSHRIQLRFIDAETDSNDRVSRIPIERPRLGPLIGELNAQVLAHDALSAGALEYTKHQEGRDDRRHNHSETITPTIGYPGEGVPNDHCYASPHDGTREHSVDRAAKKQANSSCNNGPDTGRKPISSHKALEAHMRHTHAHLYREEVS